VKSRRAVMQQWRITLEICYLKIKMSEGRSMNRYTIGKKFSLSSVLSQLQGYKIAIGEVPVQDLNTDEGTFFGELTVQAAKHNDTPNKFFTKPEIHKPRKFNPYKPRSQAPVPTTTTISNSTDGKIF